MPAVIFKENEDLFAVLDPYYGGQWEFNKDEIRAFLEINQYELYKDADNQELFLDEYLKSDAIAAEVYNFMISENIPRMPHYFPKAIINKLDNQKAGIVTPPEVVLEVSRKCNYSCRWCYISDMNNAEDELSIDELKKYLIEPLVKVGARRWTLSGGEPSVTFEKTIELAKAINHESEAAWGIKPEIDILTNGYRFSRYAKDYFKNNIKTVQFNLSSPYETDDNRLRVPDNESINSFREVIEGIKEAKNIGFTTSINMVVGPDNKNSISDMIKLASQLRVDWLRLTPVVMSGKAKKNKIFLDFEEYSKIAEVIDDLTNGKNVIAKGLKIYFPSIDLEYNRPMWCGLGYLDYYVGYNGLIYPCNNLIEKDLLCDEHDIRNISATEIWYNSPNLIRFRKYRTNNVGEECGKCASRSYCVGNCIARCWHQYGQFDLLKKPASCLLK